MLIMETQVSSRLTKSCIRVNTRELDRELCTGLSILYTLD